MKSKAGIEILKDLFWDYDWESVLKNLDSPFVIARVLEMENKEQVKAFVSRIGSERIREFLTKYEKLLSKQSLNFWKLIYETKEKSLTREHQKLIRKISSVLEEGEFYLAGGTAVYYYLLEDILCMKINAIISL